MIVLGLVLFGGIGTYVYTQAQKKDIQAKAGAFLLNPNDYIGNKQTGIRFALCKRTTKDGKPTEVLGIVSRPSLLYFSSGGLHQAILSVYDSANEGGATDTSISTSWFPADPSAYTYVSDKYGLKSSQSIGLEYYHSANYPSSKVSTKRIPLLFIPKC